MELSNPTFEVILDTRREKSDGTFPLKLRVTFKRVRKYYGMDISLTSHQYEKLSSSNLRDDALKEVKVTIRAKEAKADKVYKSMDIFTFREFEKRYFEDAQQPKSSSVYLLIEQYAQQLRSEGRISTSDSYISTNSSLKSVKKKLEFDDITPSFLRNYEKTMIDKGKSPTTVGIYLRNLRAIYNQAVEAGVASKENYPFRKNRFSIPAGRNVKKALTLQEIGNIFNYETSPSTNEDKAKDFWIFSYLCNGLNIKDICQIKYKDIDGSSLKVVRAKTQRTTKANQRPIIIPLMDPAIAVISKWGQCPKSPDQYVFDILPQNVTPERERELVQYFTKFINKYINRIGEDLGIDKHITTYTARHSFSTVLKRSGVSTEFISESLGHANLSTTESYLDSFEDDVKKEYANYLTNFDGK